MSDWVAVEIVFHNGARFETNQNRANKAQNCSDWVEAACCYFPSREANPITNMLIKCLNDLSLVKYDEYVFII